MIRAERRKVRPPIPRAFADLGQRLLNNYGRTANIYLGQINGADDSIGYIFGSQMMLQLVNEATELHIDGTFAV